MEKTVLASVPAFYFLHTVRFGRLQEDAHPPHDPDHSDDDSVDGMGGVPVKRSPHRTTSRVSEDSDSDPSTSPKATQGPPKRRCPPVDHTVPTVIATAAPPPSGLSISTNSPLSLPLRAPGAVRDRRHVGVAGQNCFENPRRAQRLAAKTKPPVHPLDVHILLYQLYGNDQSGGAKITLLSLTLLTLMSWNSVQQSGLSGQIRMLRRK